MNEWVRGQDSRITHYAYSHHIFEQTLASFPGLASLSPGFEFLIICIATLVYNQHSASLAPVFDSLHQERPGNERRIRLRWCLGADHSPLASYPSSFSCVERRSEANSLMHLHCLCSNKSAVHYKYLHTVI